MAAMCSLTISFSLIRAVVVTALRSFNHRWADKIFAHLDERPIVSVALLRLMFQMVPALRYALALAGIRFFDDSIGTVLELPNPFLFDSSFFDFSPSTF